MVSGIQNLDVLWNSKGKKAKATGEHIERSLLTSFKGLMLENFVVSPRVGPSQIHSTCASLHTSW